MKQIYFIRAADGTGPIKIGTSSDLECRRAQLSSDLRTPLVILAMAPGSYPEEVRIHWMFSAHRLYGEWFSPNNIVLEYIEHVKTDGKLPPFADESPAVHIITSLGGIRGLARRLGHKNHTTVQGWWERETIPADRLGEVLGVAAKAFSDKAAA